MVVYATPPTLWSLRRDVLSYWPDLRTRPYNSSSSTHVRSPAGGTASCFYKNQVYMQDQVWKDGCDYKCTCIDASTGRYSCSALYVARNNVQFFKILIYTLTIYNCVPYFHVKRFSEVVAVFNFHTLYTSVIIII